MNEPNENRDKYILIRRIGLIGAAALIAPSPARASVLQKIPNNLGLVGYWPMNEGTSTIAGDFSGNGNSGTLTSMASPPTATSGWATAGKRGGALNFDGVNDLVNVGAKLDGLGPLTVSAWIYPRSMGESNVGAIVAKDIALSSGNWFLRFGTNTNGLMFNKNGSTALQVKAATSTITLNQWQHVVVTWTGGTATSTVKIYKNGVEVSYDWKNSAAGVSLNSDAGLPFGIGNRSSTATTFDGLIDEVRIYNRALSASEIRQDMMGYSPKEF